MKRRTANNTGANTKVGADETTALQGGRAKNALLAVTDGETEINTLCAA
ncbi:MAG: hypothetical protein Q7J21_11870 [Rugosibacter sp.]|nr:hypothetical protein [Rugosibacter sp.]